MEKVAVPSGLQCLTFWRGLKSEHGEGGAASPLRTFENELGVQAPVGVCDPSGSTADGNFEYLARRRQTELQRGRVSLLTTMCYVTLEIVVKLPGCLSPSAGLKFADIPNRLAAISEVPAGGWGQILAYEGFCELS